MKICQFFATLLFGFIGWVSSEPILADLYFVLSAKDLPEMGLFDKIPDPYVEVTYFRSPDTPPTYFTAKTNDLSDTYNPVWPELFKITFREGHLQKLRFVIMDHNVGADEEIGRLIVSLSELYKAPNNKLERSIVGKRLKSGEFIIHTSINKTIIDETDERIISPKEKAIALKRIVEVAD